MSGSFHERLKGKVIKTDDWVEKHRPHLKDEKFNSEPFPHPSGRWIWIVCKCKAKHLVIMDKKDFLDNDSIKEAKLS